jgi:4-hydroxy-tetrahydrodipicolinate reductase
MDLFLVGSTGRLGSAVMRLAKEKNISTTILDRNLFDTQSDCVILDVSLAEGTKNLCLNLIKIADQKKHSLRYIKSLVIGTTGHDQETKDLFVKLSAVIPICVVSNFSKGIFLFEQMLDATTQSGLPVWELAQKLGFDLSIFEAHHAQKKDAPSGTALSLADVAHVPLDKITSVREGQVTGKHTLFAKGQFEELRITHEAHSRDLFAAGALDLCQNIFDKKPDCGILFRKDFL